MTEAATATVAFSLETWPSGPQRSQCRLCDLVEFLASEPEQRPHLQNKAVQVMCSQRLDRERQEPASFVLTGTSQFLLIHRRVSSGFSTMHHLYPARWGWSPRPRGINKNGCGCGHVHGTAPVGARGQGVWELFVPLYCGFWGLNSVHEACVLYLLSHVAGPFLLTSSLSPSFSL